MSGVNDSLWKLQCKDERCKRFFDYFGRSQSNKIISCTHCGRSSKHGSADFIRHNPDDSR